MIAAPPPNSFRVLRPGGTIARNRSLVGSGDGQLGARLANITPRHRSADTCVFTASREIKRATQGTAGFTLTGSHQAHALHSPYWWLKCAVGVNNERQRDREEVPRSLGVGSHETPAATQIPEKLLTPVIGKSLVVYGRKP